MIASAGFFGKLGVCSFRHARLILAAAVLAFLGSAWSLRDLRFDTISAVLAVDDPEMEAYVRSIETFGDSGSLLIRMTPGEAPLSSLDRWTDAAASELSAWKDIRYVESGPVDFSDVRDSAAFLRASILNSGPGILEAFAARFEDGGLERELRRYRKYLLAASDPELQENLSLDPLGLRALLEARLEAMRGNMKLSGSGRYLDAGNGRSRILIAHPAGFSEDINYSQDLVKRVRILMEATREKAGVPRGAAFGVTGKYAQADEASRIVIEDMRLLSLAAGLLVFLLVWAVFRKARAVLVAVIPLVFSISAAFIYARFCFNPLSAVAMAFAAIILGLGIDILLHLTGRIFQVYPSSASLEEAVRLTFEECGPPISIGVVTTAAAFLCLAFTRFEAISQFGLLTSGSLVITLAVSLVTFPAAVRCLFPGDFPLLEPRFQKLPVRIFSFSSGHPRLALGIGLALVLLSLAGARNFRLEMDLFKGIPDSMPSMAVARETAADFGTSLVLNSQLLVTASSPGEAMEAQQAVDRKLEELVRSGRIAGFQPPSLYLPYPASLERSGVDLSRLGARIREGRGEFFSLLERLKIRSSPNLETYYDILEEAFPPGGLASPATRVDLRDPRIARCLKLGDGATLQTLIWPDDEDGDIAQAKDVSLDFQGFQSPNSSRILVTGTLQFYEMLNRLLRSEFFRISLIGLAAVAVLAGLFLRGLSTTLISLVPLLGAVPFTFAVLALCGLSFTPGGIGVTAIVLGIGIDNAIHILARVRNQPSSRLGQVLRDIGPVLFLTAISTMLGFGALSLSRIYSIRSMGIAVAVGVFACLLYTILFVPSLVRLTGKGSKGASLPPVIPLLVLLILSGTAFSRPVTQDSRLEEILENLERRYSSTEAFSVDFEQVKSIRQLTEPMEITGSLVFRKPHFVRMEIRGEENLNLYVDGEHVWLEDLDFGEVDRFEFSGSESRPELARVLPPVFAGGIAEMRNLFEAGLDRSGGRETVELVPRSGQVSPYRRIRFEVGGFSRITWMKVEFGNGDWVETRFRGWKTLPGISEHYFRYRKEE